MDPKEALDELHDIIEEYLEAYGRPHFEDTRVRLLARLNERARELDKWALRMCLRRDRARSNGRPLANLSCRQGRGCRPRLL
jgi:hypothetical protein